MKALSIRQPWAWLILHASKDIENRSWPTGFRGDCLLHAAKIMTQEDYDAAWMLARCDNVVLPSPSTLERGGVIGQITITGCVNVSDSPWFFGPWGFLLSNPKPLPFHPCKGRLGFFEIHYPFP